MLEKLSEKLSRQLDVEMEKASTIQNPLAKLREALVPVQKALTSLKMAVTDETFVDKQSEVHFFKYQKPKIYAWLIFITERYAIENAMPPMLKADQIAYLQQQLFFINRFFRQNEFMYQYFKLDEKDLDEKYFIRGQVHPLIGFSEIPEVDRSFATAADYLFSKFIAYEKLQRYLLEEIQSKTMQEGEVHKVRQGQLKWTGESINMVELIYGIYETAQVNNGEVSLSELMDYLGQMFQTNLSMYFKRFSEIKRRKAMSKTRFLEEMAKLVNKRIDDGDAFIP